MKKVLFILAIAIAATGSVNAQDVKIGAKVGLNLASITGGDVYGEDSDTKIGFNQGLFAEISLSDKFIFQPELLFSTQGNVYKQGSFDDLIKITIELDYLNIPLLIKYAVSDKFALEFGPQLGFLLSANTDVEGILFDNETISVRQDVKDSFKSIDLGLNFGISIDVSEKVMIGARYNLGLSNISDEEDIGIEEDINVKNSLFSMFVGYRF